MGATGSFARKDDGVESEPGSSALFAAQEYASKSKKMKKINIGTLSGKFGLRPPLSPKAHSFGSFGSLNRVNSSKKEMALIVEVIDAHGFKLPVSDVCVRVSLCRFIEFRQSYVVLSQTTTPKRSNTLQPTWHTYRLLFPYVNSADILQIELIAEKRMINTTTTVLATGEMTIGKFEGDLKGSKKKLSTISDLNFETVSVTLKPTLALQQTQDEPIQVRIRRVRPPIGELVRKRVFLLRHGESRWNAAQAKGDVLSMLGSKDHPLNAAGIEQARDFGKRLKFTKEVYLKKLEDEEDPCNQTIGSDPCSTARDNSETGKVDLKSFESSFFDADQILVSPLRRAIQTAIITLQEHKRLQESGMKLYSNIREVQNLLGKDSRGEVFGDQSIERAIQNLESEIGKEEAAKLMKNCALVDPFDTESTWWLNSKESKASVLVRMEELINFIHYSDFQSVIVVGHSLFFRHILQSIQSCFDPEEMDNTTYLRKSMLMEQLRTRKIENCGCVGLELEFIMDNYPHMRKLSSLTELLPNDEDIALLRVGDPHLAASLLPSESLVDGQDFHIKEEQQQTEMKEIGVVEEGKETDGDGEIEKEKEKIETTHRRKSSAGKFEHLASRKSSGGIYDHLASRKSSNGSFARLRIDVSRGSDQSDDSSIRSPKSDGLQSNTLQSATIVDVEMMFGSGFANALEDSQAFSKDNNFEHTT